MVNLKFSKWRLAAPFSRTIIEIIPESVYYRILDYIIIFIDLKKRGEMSKQCKTTVHISDMN